jgi:hypothetical protein
VIVACADTVVDVEAPVNVPVRTVVCVPWNTTDALCPLPRVVDPSLLGSMIGFQHILSAPEMSFRTLMR